MMPSQRAQAGPRHDSKTSRQDNYTQISCHQPHVAAPVLIQ
jgi:hypothetical protein